MLRAFSASTGKLEPTTALPRTGWLHVSDPTDAELTQLREQLGVPGDFLRHALDQGEIARIDKDEGGASLIVMRVPHYQGQGHDLPYRSMPIGVVLLPGLQVTLCRIHPEVIDALLQLKGLAPTNPHRFVLQLMLCTSESFLTQVQAIDRAVGQLEDQLQASLRNKEVLELLKYQKGLVYFTTALRSNELLLERLQKDARFPISPEDHDLLEDVLIEIQQAIEMVTVSGNILGQMMDAFASIISNNLNVVMKVLTSFTIILTIPTMVASIYGMNVHLPGQDHPAAFVGVLLVSVAVAFVVAVVFLRKHWL